ncbi:MULTISPECIES: 4-hydroxy-tetrahydrodipicolinate synthase [unclassified Gemella]|uniref:4-hydroxy-tetrahydrodipicolinate synthase n=1 Tax=unclassified Gemella TaxID=2624949 RepID=UPI001C054999|nr:MULTISPECIES: 4-hydroxy-tetrahydrodipicolinate synthase [unclassified Gemella]MBU0278062.1 4-hydroxy-tetrahydrodipicolinate synthase [Gemella sp. zg-1178]QWQ38410.1 4-hydroxy-tetrahydrodipicolinate synthase [Gemella sp. zg-570]
MSIYRGSGVAIVTPFLENGSIDYATFEELLEFQIKEGTDAIIVAGTTGESATMTDDEQIAIIKFAVDKVKKRVPLIAGTGSNNTKHAAELSIEAEKLGVDALLVVTPYYNKTSQKGLIEHFEYIANSVNIPIILYGVPGRTGQIMTAETISHLSKHKNIVAYKDAVGNISHTLEVLNLCGDNIDIYSGNDDINVPIILAGGKGCISVLANIYPKATHDMCNLALSGDIKNSMQLQLKYNKFVNLLFSEPNPMPVKKCVEYLGYGTCNYRLPMTNISDTLADLLKTEMERLK